MVGESPRILASKRTGYGGFSIDEAGRPGRLLRRECVISDLPDEQEVLIAPLNTFAIWVDDHLVERKDPRVWGVWTRLGVRVRLVKGRHRILLQVGEPQVAVRFLHPDGRPLGIASQA